MGKRSSSGSSQRASKGNDRLLAAVKTADVETVRKQIAEGVQPDAEATRIAAEECNLAFAAANPLGKSKGGLADLFGRMSRQPKKTDRAGAAAKADAYQEITEILLKAGAKVPNQLVAAARHANTRLAALLLKHGADVNYDPPAGTPLENAVQSGNAEMVRMIIKAGGDVNRQGYLGSVLSGAVRANQVEAAEELILAGADVNLVPRFGSTALMAAVRENHSHFVELLLRHGANPNLKEGVSVGEFGEPEVKIEGGCRITHRENPEFVEAITPLILSIRQGNADTATKLIEAGADLEAVDSNGLSAMAYAVRAKDAAMIRLLTGAGAKPLEYAEGSRELAWITAAKNGDCARLRELLKDGVNVNLKHVSSTEEEEGTALTHAAENGRLDAVKLLLRSGANVDEKCGASGEDGRRTALMHAARGGRADVAMVLLESGASAVAKDKAGETPLHYAAKYGHAEVIRVLVRSGAKVEAVSRGGLTPLMEAAGAGHSEATRTLLELKADPNAKTKDGLSALFSAASEGNKDLVKLLLEYGALPSAEDSMFSPLEAATSGGHNAVVTLLLKAQKEQARKSGKVARPDIEALIGAIMSGKLQLVKSLLDAGADPNGTMRDSHHTALMMGVRIGNAEIVELLLKSGANVNALNEERETALDLAYDNIRVVHDQLLLMSKLVGGKQQREMRDELRLSGGEDELTTLLKKAGGRRGKDMKDVPTPKSGEPEPDVDRCCDDLPVPDFTEAAKLPEFQKAIREVESLCGAKAREFSSDEDHPLRGCVQFEADTKLADTILAGHHESFLKRGFYLVKSSRGYASNKDQLTLLPTDKRSEVFAAFGTNGANYDVLPADVVRWFDELEKSQPFVLTGAGYDWCEGRFTQLIRDSKKLAKEMYEFCPDIVDQGVGDSSRLALELKRTQQFFFWWD